MSAIDTLRDLLAQLGPTEVVPGILRIDDEQRGYWLVRSDSWRAAVAAARRQARQWDSAADGTATCDTCGGEIPPHDSEAWASSDGICPGAVEDDGRCGAFGPSEDRDSSEDAQSLYEILCDETHSDSFCPGGSERDDGPALAELGADAIAWCREDERAGHSIWSSALSDLIEVEVELFGRESGASAPGWVMWGNQIPRTLFAKALSHECEIPDRVLGTSGSVR